MERMGKLHIRYILEAADRLLNKAGVFRISQGKISLKIKEITYLSLMKTESSSLRFLVMFTLQRVMMGLLLK